MSAVHKPLIEAAAGFSLRWFSAPEHAASQPVSVWRLRPKSFTPQLLAVIYDDADLDLFVEALLGARELAREPVAVGEIFKFDHAEYQLFAAVLHLHDGLTWRAL